MTLHNLQAINLILIVVNLALSGHGLILLRKTQALNKKLNALLTEAKKNLLNINALSEKVKSKNETDSTSLSEHRSTVKAPPTTTGL